MGISKTEINLRRLLASAPQQQNQAKLIHYIATLREQLEQLSEERTADDLPRISKSVLNDYSVKIEAIASKLADPLLEIQFSGESLDGDSPKGSPSNKDKDDHIHPTPGLRRRLVPPSNIEDRSHSTTQADASAPVKLDAAAQAHIEKHSLIYIYGSILFLGQLEFSSCEQIASLLNCRSLLLPKDVPALHQ